MKILILADGIPPESLGGAEVVAWNTARALARAGADVHLITTTRLRGVVGESEREGVRVYALYSHYHERWRAYLSLYNPQTVPQVEALINRIKPDVVHAHNIHYHLSYHCLKLARESGAKVLLTAHDVMLFHYGKLPGRAVGKISPWQQLLKYQLRYNPFRNRVIRFYLRYVHKILAVSHALKRVLNENGIENVGVFYNGLDRAEWVVNPHAAEVFKNAYGLENKKVVLFGGRLSQAKGGDQALAALEHVAATVPEVVLLVLGRQNEYTRALTQVATEKGLLNHLVFTDWLSGEELKAAYHVSDVVIVPSICFDTFGMVCLEAMACSKAVIGSCFGGMREVISDGQTGYVINPYDIKQMSENILTLLQDSHMADRMGAAGYDKSHQDFDLSKQISNLYNHVY